MRLWTSDRRGDRLRAWWTGFKDGWQSPFCLSMGMTWDDQGLNESYDRGANAGQRLRSPLHHERRD